MPGLLRPGGICRSVLETGIGFMSATIAGRRKASGPVGLKRLPIRILKPFPWTVVSCGFISMARAKKDREGQAIGRSRGGLTTKIHAAVDALGNPVRLLLTAGQASEYGQANALIEGFNVDHVVADKGYDSDDLVETIERSGATAVIPPRKTAKT